MFMRPLSPVTRTKWNGDCDCTLSFALGLQDWLGPQTDADPARFSLGFGRASWATPDGGSHPSKRTSGSWLRRDPQLTVNGSSQEPRRLGAPGRACV